MENLLGPEFAQLGVGVILAILIVKETVGVLRKAGLIKAPVNGNPGHGPSATKCELPPEIVRQIQDLYEWHNVSDSEGVKRWYIRRSMADGIDQIAKDTAESKELLRTLIHEVKRLGESE